MVQDLLCLYDNMCWICLTWFLIFKINWLTFRTYLNHCSDIMFYIWIFENDIVSRIGSNIYTLFHSIQSFALSLSFFLNWNFRSEPGWRLWKNSSVFSSRTFDCLSVSRSFFTELSYSVSRSRVIAKLSTTLSFLKEPSFTVSCSR